MADWLGDYETFAAAPDYTESIYGAGGGYSPISGKNPSSYNTSVYTPAKSQQYQGLGSKTGKSVYDFLQGLKSSPLGSQLFGGGSKYGQLLTGSEPYKQLLAGASMPFGDWYGQVEGKVEQNYAPVLKYLQGVLDSANPSGLPVASAELLAAPGMAAAEAGAKDLRQGLLESGQEGGNVSGASLLSSLLPGQMLAAERGRRLTEGSLGAHELERQRAGINANLKTGASGTMAGIAGQKSSLAAGALGQHSALAQSAWQSAMQALISVLGLDASMVPKLSLGGSLDDPQFSLSGPLGSY